MKTVFNKLIDVSLNITDGVHNTVVDDVDGDCFLLSAKNIKNGLVNFDNNDRRINDAVRAKLNKRTQMSVGDVLFTTVGTLGETALADTNCNKYEFQRSVAIIKPNKEIIDSRYLYYLLKSNSYNYYFKSIATGAAQPCIFIGNLAKTKIKYFEDIAYQRQIADILSTYDELIENNNKRIAILEQMAENLYKEWFVRFRFPGYETAEFENGLPKGWEIKKLADFGRVETGKTPSTEIADNYGEEYMFVKTPDMHGNVFTIQTSEYLSQQGHSTQPKKLLPQNSIMVSCIGTGGVVSINAKPAHTNQQINSIILNNTDLLEWLFFTCKSLKETILLFGATGATMTNLSKGKFEKLKVIAPSEDLILKFHNIAYPIFEQIKFLMNQNQNLIKQRDLLLPRLMSGKLEV